MTLPEQLKTGLASLDLTVSAPTCQRLLEYVALLKKWNRTYNLTAIREEPQMVTHHLLDSLSILPALRRRQLALPKRWADIGSGAGLPGIPLAIVHPELEFTLIETVEKKSTFQRQVKIELGLDNLSVVTARVEAVTDSVFDVVISRAFAELAQFVRLAGHLVAPAGWLLAMKGARSDEELSRLPEGWRLADCLKLAVPGVDAQRHLIVLEKA